MFFTLASQWLLLALAAIISFVAGWFLAKKRCKCDDAPLRSELATVHGNLAAARTEIDEHKSKIQGFASLSGEADGHRSKVGALEAAAAAATAAAGAAALKAKSENDALRAEIAGLRSSNESELAKLRSSVSAETQRANTLAADDESDKSKIAELQAQVSKQTTEAQALRRQIDELSTKSETLAADDADDKARIERLSARVRELEGSHAANESRIQGFSSQADTDRSRIDDMSKAHAAALAASAAAANNAAANHKHEMDALNAELQTWKSKSATLAADDASDKSAIDRLSARVQQLEASEQAHQSRFRSFTSSRDEDRARVTDLEKAAAAAAAGAAAAATSRDAKHRNEIEALAAQIASLRAANAAELRRNASLASDDASDKAQIDSLSARILELQSELDARSARLQGFASIPDAPARPDLAGAADIVGIAVAHDDLKVVEGIGPKIDELLQGAGITTWWGLAYTSTERIRDILDEAGPAYRIADPTTWPQQSKLLAQGRWAEFKALTDSLKAGRR
jgi:predicted flap endonuclease-1-like 5' DNA nuclease/FtsZ-binding cell division protein ZapB